MRAAVVDRVTLEAWSELPAGAASTLGQLGMWIREIETLARDVRLADDDVNRRIERFVALDPAQDALGNAFDHVFNALRRGPLGDTLGPLWDNQLAASLYAMTAHRRPPAPARHKRDPFEAYLERAADGACVAVALTAAAILVGERGALTSIASLAAAERHASIAVALAHDPLADGLATEPAVRARIAAERGAFDAAASTLEVHAPRTATITRRFADHLLAREIARVAA